MKNILKGAIAVLLGFTLSALCACSGGSASSLFPSSGREDESSQSVSDSGNSGDSGVSGSTNDSSAMNSADDAGDLRKRYGYEPRRAETLPRVDISTADTGYATDYNRDSKLAGAIEYVDCSVSVSNCADAEILAEAAGKVKVRGNYTLNYPKKPLRLKFDKKQNLLGMNDGKKFKSWVLLADYKDSSLLRNSTSFYFGKTILGADGYYSADYRDVEVYLNGQYWGKYLLTEQQQTGKNRVDIAEAEEGYEGTDIGYLIEYDGYYDQEPEEERELTTFTVDYYNRGRIQRLDGKQTDALVKGYTIKSDVYSTSQTNYIGNYIKNVYEIFYRAVYENSYYAFNEDYTKLVKSSATNAYEAISSVVDVQSLVDMYILQEIACDYDINWSSFYMSVDMSAEGNKKLTFCAPWDFDSAFGGKNMQNGRGMFAANSRNPWMVLPVRQSWFTDMVKEKWSEICEAGVPQKALLQIKECKTLYGEYYGKNFDRWKNCMGNKFGDELFDIFTTFRTEADAADYLYNWLVARLNYLNEKNVWGDGTMIAK